MAQKAYVSLATSRPSAKWLAQAALGVEPPLPDAERVLILAGNNKIRLLCSFDGVVYGILKSGFPRHFMLREIEARRQAEELGLPVPPLEIAGKDGTWFKERYVCGTPVNRLADRALAGKVVCDAAAALKRLLDYTKREEHIEDYTARLREQIRVLLHSNRSIRDSLRESLLCTVDLILQLVRSLRSRAGSYIVTAISHGDFQPANILYDRQGIWLVDWEYSARRQAGYDALVFALRSRFPEGLTVRLRRIVEARNFRQAPLLADWPGLNWQHGVWRRLHGLVFLLEEMALRLEENANPYFRGPLEGFRLFHREASNWARTMANKA